MSAYTGKYATRLEAAEKRMMTASTYMQGALEAILIQALKDLSRAYPDCEVAAQQVPDGLLNFSIRKGAIRLDVTEQGYVPAAQKDLPIVGRVQQVWTDAKAAWGLHVLPTTQSWTVRNGVLQETRSDR